MEEPSDPDSPSSAAAEGSRASADEPLRSVHTANSPECLDVLGMSLVVTTYQAGKLIVDQRPKHVTYLGTIDTADGWRENKAHGGFRLDVETDETILGGLSLPHSSRGYGQRLWVLEAGKGSLAAC